jgi:hypothetical protein
MSLLYIRLLMAAAFCISITGASFSIIGLAKLFAGAPFSVAFMAAALEFAKLVVTGFLYRYWGHVPKLMRAYLTVAVAILMCITSMGIYGYLSSAYQQSSMKLHEEELRMSILESDNARLLSQIEDSRHYVDTIPDSYMTRKLQFRQESEKEIKTLRERSNQMVEEISALKGDMLLTQAKIGPIIYVAKAVGADPEHCVNFLILLFVIVFDPLAVCLIFALNMAIRLREKYRGNEQRIGGHSLTNPVDHRFKKSA